MNDFMDTKVKDKFKDSKKKIFIGLGIVVIFIVLIGVSFAWWTNTATQESINKITSDCLQLTIEDVNQSAINLEKAYPITDAEASTLTPYTFNIVNTCSNSAEYSVQLEIMDLGENQLASQYLAMDFNNEGKKLVNQYQSVTPTYKESDYTANEARLLKTGVLSGNESIVYNLKIWMDESVTENDPTMNKEFIAKVSVVSSLTQVVLQNFSEFVMNKNEVERIEHEATEQTPALTDYRYVGSNPNNYVYFGCSDNCTEDNLYRIIGVIPTQNSETGSYKNRVKLIKANYYTENESGLLKESNTNYPAKGGYGYNWNSSANNKWEESTLQNQVLNGVYWNSLGEYQSYIEQAKWYLGAVDYNNYTMYTPEDFYNIERSNTQGYSKGVISYINNIGLMYPSDYGYSIGIEYQEQSIYSNGAKYVSNDWLYQLENQYYEWTMTPESNDSHIYAWAFASAGHIRCSNTYHSSSIIWGIRPTFYLKEDVLVVGGTGTSSDPYKINIEDNKFSDYIIAQKESDTNIVKVDHEATNQTPALTDYRYVGSNPNNYVCFGYDGNRCPDDNLYRIIGVIPTQSTDIGSYQNRVKLIKANYYTEETSGLLLVSEETNPPGGGSGKGYYWNSSANNQWQASTLQSKVLNGVYYSSLGEYQNFISPAVWYLGAPTYSSYQTYTPDQFYNIERSNTKGYSGGAISYINNIGLMYPSDYGYSLGSSNANNSIYENRENNKTNSWLYNLENKYYEWIMTPESSSGNVFAWSLYPAGHVSYNYVYNSSGVWGVRPVFYLTGDVQYVGGNGSIDDPYRIGL